MATTPKAPPTVVGTSSTVAAPPKPVTVNKLPAPGSNPTLSLPDPGPDAGSTSLAAHASAVAPGGTSNTTLHPSVKAVSPSSGLPTGGSLWDTAQAQAAAALDPAIDDLKGQMTYAQTQAANSAAGIKADAARQEDNAKLIYDALSHTLAGLNHKEQEGFANTQIAVGKNYDALRARLGELFSGQGGALGDEAARLGLQSAQGQASQGLLTGQQLLQGLADTSKANTGSVLWNERRGFDAIGKNAAERAHYTGAERVSELQTLSNKQLTKLQNDTNAALTLLRSKIGSLTANKAQQAAVIYQQLQAQAAQVAEARAARASSNALQLRRLQDDESNTAFNQQYKLAQLQGKNSNVKYKGLTGAEQLAQLLANGAVDTAPTSGGFGINKALSTLKSIMPKGANVQGGQALMNLLQENWQPAHNNSKGKLPIGGSLYSFATAGGVDPERLNAQIAREAQNTTTQRLLFGNSGPQQQAMLADYLQQLYAALVGKY